MTSFLTNVLVAAGKLEKDNLREKTQEIETQITRLKYDVRYFMQDNYIEFASNLTDDQSLVMKAETLIEEISALQKRLEEQTKIQLKGVTKELESLSQILKEYTISLHLSQELLALNGCIKCIQSFEKEKRYVDAAKGLRRMQALLENESDLHDVKIYTAIREEYSNLYSTFLTDASRLWHEQICWTGIEDKKECIVVSLKINPEAGDIAELIRGLYIIDNLSTYLHDFATTLMQYIIKPIINYRCSVYVVKEKMFTVEIINKQEVTSYSCVLHNLKLLFKFLHQHFGITIDRDQNFFINLQPNLLSNLASALISDCISRTIPSSSEELTNFKIVMNAIEDFQNYLIEIGFISKDQLFLSEYTKNIDKLFVDRICRDFLAKARTIMKKDLHDSIQYNPKELLPNLPPELEDQRVIIKRKLSENSFHWPKCQISKSVKEILDLAKNILEEVCRSPETCAIRLFYTCRNVFDMYAGLVPAHHKKFLETIPQQVALFHNNCMYLAHHLLTLAHEYRSRFPQSLQQLNLTFADQVLVLREVGTECFLEHMRYQRNIIIDILKESGLSALGHTSELYPGIERALRQCVRQMELLKIVWLDVLPEKTYCKAIGCIADSMLEDLVIRVISIEDIPADIANELITVFNMTAKRIPQIFPDPAAIHKYIRNWSKFLALINILGASLKDIEIGWGDGTGPLAKEFMATQVKQLIRALFQNTDRRSSTLSHIK